MAVLDHSLRLLALAGLEPVLGLFFSGLKRMLDRSMLEFLLLLVEMVLVVELLLQAETVIQSNSIVPM